MGGMDISGILLSVLIFYKKIQLLDHFSPLLFFPAITLEESTMTTIKEGLRIPDAREARFLVEFKLEMRIFNRN